MSEEFPPNLKGTEAALAALAPIPAALDRDRLMFRAGQAALARSRWAWPAATGLLAAVAVTLVLVMLLRPPVVTETVVVYVPVEKLPAPPPPQTGPETPAAPHTVALRPVEVDTGPLAPPNSLKLQEQILRWGLDALYEAPHAIQVEPPLTLRKLLGESPRHSEPAPWWQLDQLIPLGGQS